MAITKKPKINLICPKGKTFAHSIYIQDDFEKAIILQGYTGRVEIRDELPSDSSTVGDSNVALTLTTENGGIEIDEDAGKATLRISAAETASLDAQTYFWELELISPEGEIPYIMDISKLKVIGEVTLNA